MNILKYNLTWLAVMGLVLLPISSSVMGAETGINKSNAWQDEQKTVTILSKTMDDTGIGYSGHSNSNAAPDMSDIGKGVTSNLLKTLTMKDLRIGGVAIGETIPATHETTDAGAFPTEVTSTKGVFETHSGKDVSYTVYRNSTEVVQQAYPFRDGEIVQIHIGEGSYQTPRTLGVGSTRGMLLFLYGAPNSMMREANGDTTVFFYDTLNSQSIREERAIPGTFRPMKDIRGGSIAFTIENSRITAVDMFASAIVESGIVPLLDRHTFVANQLIPADFSLRGFHLNTSFAAPSTEVWKSKGNLWNSPFTEYAGAVVNYDQKNQIIRVMAMDGTVFTPRGISMGDTRFLLMYLYGEPTRIVSNAEFFKHEKNWDVYEYKNPYSEYEYLLFAVDKESGFIKTILLSDRSAENIRVVSSKEN